IESDEKERRKALVDFALPKNIQGLQDDLRKYRIEYNTWFKESSLHNSGETERIIELLKKSGYTYVSEDALWFKATDFGCDKDFVLVRANGVPTYVVPDIAYHYNKLVTRKFDKAIDILGADHHGYVPRLKAALSALGVDASKLDAVLMQMVRLVRDGEVIKASKRSGKAITLVTLLDEVPIDAARFFFNLREPNSHFDFDLDLAVNESNSNPVYYVQYAYARICSIIRNLESEGIKIRVPELDELSYLKEPEEKALISHLAGLTDEIINAAKTYDPAKITHYVLELATKFHKFYSVCRVKGENESLMQARLMLCLDTAIVIYNILSMLKITAPKKM
ncbi:MAG: arginine--tRNA ligase, partial [Alphaproteobacteria bacterium]|nr:arginine--tRNA ligase [Alphaproteobacteria bacterium]